MINMCIVSFMFPMMDVNLEKDEESFDRLVENRTKLRHRQVYSCERQLPETAVCLQSASSDKLSYEVSGFEKTNGEM